MDFEFDPAKNESNFLKHGLSLVDAQRLWNVRGVEITLVPTKGEFRYARLGPINGVIHVAVYSCRGMVVRLISARAADAAETALYEQRIQQR